MIKYKSFIRRKPTDRIQACRITLDNLDECVAIWKEQVAGDSDADIKYVNGEKDRFKEWIAKDGYAVLVYCENHEFSKYGIFNKETFDNYFQEEYEKKHKFL